MRTGELTIKLDGFHYNSCLSRYGIWSVHCLVANQTCETASNKQLEDLQHVNIGNDRTKNPVKAMLGDEIEEKAYEKALDDFYHYIDLTNEQVFLRQNNRISRQTLPKLV